MIFSKKMSYKVFWGDQKQSENNIKLFSRNLRIYVQKIEKKNQPPILAKYFEKKKIPIFFRKYSKINFRNIYLSELKKFRKIMK